MQISSGWSKGLKILTPAGNETRPTRERVRASAINMLQPFLSSAVVLDLFAGSGSVGLEMVSRGAEGAVFVENDAAALKCLRANFAGLMDRAAKQAIKVSPASVDASAVAKALSKGWPFGFSLIWADPPYEHVSEFLNSNGEGLNRALNADGVFALETGTESAAGVVSEFSSRQGWKIIKQREYGVTLITIYQKPS